VWPGEWAGGQEGGETRDKGGKRERAARGVGESNPRGRVRGRNGGRSDISEGKEIERERERERGMRLARWNRAMDTSRPLYPAALMRNNTRDCHFEAAANVERARRGDRTRIRTIACTRITAIAIAPLRCVADWKVGAWSEMHRSDPRSQPSRIDIPRIPSWRTSRTTDRRADLADASGVNGREIVGKRAERIARLAWKNREPIGSRSRRRIASWIIGGLAIMSGSAPIRSAWRKGQALDLRRA
jgi:hypothetical protein